jgi:hypothetical protein
MDAGLRDDLERRHDGPLPEGAAAALAAGGAHRADWLAAWSNSRLLDRLARLEAEAARRLRRPASPDARLRLIRCRAAAVVWFERAQGLERR